MNDIHNRPIGQRIDWLFDLARRHGETFRSPEAWLARQHYLAEHPTAIAVLKCMDGRINIPVAKCQGHTVDIELAGNVRLRAVSTRFEGVV